jgi:flagellar basal-body rod protein FlgF
MIESLGTIVEAFSARVPHLDSVAHNLANVQTPGFKAEKGYFRLKENAAAQSGTAYTAAARTDFSEGIIQRTGNPLDMAIQGKGFFTVETKDGVAYTRKGNFTINSANELITPEGNYVLGEGGRITLTGSKVQVSAGGDIRTESGIIGKLKVVDFDRTEALVKQGGCLFKNPENKAGLKTQDDSVVKSEHLENSNVQALKEMVGMIDIQRTVESYQKVIQTLGDLDRLSTNRLGKLA